MRRRKRQPLHLGDTTNRKGNLRCGVSPRGGLGGIPANFTNDRDHVTCKRCLALSTPKTHDELLVNHTRTKRK